MAYGNASKMGGYNKGYGGMAKGFNTVRYEDRGEKKGEQYSGSKYGTGSTKSQHGHGNYSYKGRY